MESHKAVGGKPGSPMGCNALADSVRPPRIKQSIHWDTDLDTGLYILNEGPPPACSTTVFAPCIPGGTLPAHVVVSTAGNGSIIHNTYDNWQPRLGLAYRLGKTTVLRASV